MRSTRNMRESIALRGAQQSMRSMARECSCAGMEVASIEDHVNETELTPHRVRPAHKLHERRPLQEPIGAASSLAVEES